jgi:hypothetical protein
MRTLPTPIPTPSPGARSRRVATTVGVALAAALVAPAAVAAHQITGRFASPLPLGAYLAGAALAVAVSFAVVFFRGGSPAPAAPVPDSDRVLRVPALLRWLLTAAGLVGWAWIIVQAAILGANTEGDVASLILWVYGWVGLALVAAFIGPAWSWLDPFGSLHRIGAALLSRLGIAGIAPASYPERFGRWPAAFGLTVFVWLELVVPAARGGQALGLVLVGYTVVTLVAMAQFGRDTWQRNGEVFSVWFAAIGRLAPRALPVGTVDRDQDGSEARPDRVRARRFASGLLEPGGDAAMLVLVAVATAGILFDGLSQTQVFFDAFGVPSLIAKTLLLLAWIALIAGLAAVVGRFVGVRAMVAGLVPIAVGYLIAHYLTYLLFDGQRIVLALTDPFGLGWNLLGIGGFEPATGWLPGGVAWSIQLLAVVGGHVVGAWAGHAVALRTAAEPRGKLTVGEARSVRLRQIPLALLMVGLTTVTLWSLGQAIVQEAPATAATGRVAEAVTWSRPALPPRGWTSPSTSGAPIRSAI